MRYVDQTTIKNEANLSSFGAYRLMPAEIVFDDTKTETQHGDSAVMWRYYDIVKVFQRFKAFIARWRDYPAVNVRLVTAIRIGEARM